MRARSIKAVGFNVKNTILAMQARYQRMANNWPAALAAAYFLNTLNYCPLSRKE